MNNSALLQSARICLRAPEPEDLEAFCRWENDTRAWESGSTFAPMSRRMLSDYIANYRADIVGERQLRLVVASADTNEPLGAVDLFEFDPINSRCGIGIIIDEEHRRRGIALESLSLTEAYARRRLSLHQLWCQVAVTNGASLALFVRAGYVRAGTLRGWLRRGREFIDVETLQLFL